MVKLFGFVVACLGLACSPAMAEAQSEPVKWAMWVARYRSDGSVAAMHAPGHVGNLVAPRSPEKASLCVSRKVPLDECTIVRNRVTAARPCAAAVVIHSDRGDALRAAVASTNGRTRAELEGWIRTTAAMHEKVYGMTNARVISSDIVCASFNVS